jgi:hypothetical protein
MPPVIKGRGQYADDFVRLTIDPQRPPDDVFFTAEVFLPATFTDNHNPVVSWKIFSREKIPAELRADAENFEQVCRAAYSRHHLRGPTRFRQTAIRRRIGGNFSVTRRHSLKIMKVRWRKIP